MECAQINITGGTGAASPTTYSIPGIYKVCHIRSTLVSPDQGKYGLTRPRQATDPGILINIYSMTPASTYTIPGPAPFSCDSSSSSSGSSSIPSSSVAATTLVTTTSKTSSSVTATSTTATGGCAAAQYAQCGGIGFSGCTACASGYTCKKTNDYYSQCL